MASNIKLLLCHLERLMVFLKGCLFILNQYLSFFESLFEDLKLTYLASLMLIYICSPLSFCLANLLSTFVLFLLLFNHLFQRILTFDTFTIFLITLDQLWTSVHFIKIVYLWLDIDTACLLTLNYSRIVLLLAIDGLSFALYHRLISQFANYLIYSFFIVSFLFNTFQTF